MDSLLTYLPVLTPILIFIIGIIINQSIKKSQENNLKLQNEKIKHDFFKYFNERYDVLNNDLLNILSTSEGETNKEEEAKIIDYLNLCAEEYYYYNKGTNKEIPIIDEDVFNNWCSGMKQYFSNDKFKNILLNEINNDDNKNSYYGFLSSKYIKDILDVYGQIN